SGSLSREKFLSSVRRTTAAANSPAAARLRALTTQISTYGGALWWEGSPRWDPSLFSFLFRCAQETYDRASELARRCAAPRPDNGVPTYGGALSSIEV